MEPEALRELREKYAEMLSMRRAHAGGGEAEGQARRRMAALAARFPGSLREIDDLELAEIVARVDKLDAAIERPGDVEPWMVAIAHFHRLARGALSVKRWLGGRRGVDEALKRAFEEEVGAIDFADDARAWGADLTALAAPPGGRDVGVVFRRLAATLDDTEDEARLRVFGPSRRERRAGGRSPADERA
jgi:hypothetical protein